MSQPVVLTIAETPGFPDFSAVYTQLGIREERVRSQRKAMSRVQKQAPDFIVAQFVYGFSNNYAGINISNLDVLLFALQKYAPQTRMIVLVDKPERQYVEQLRELFPLHAVLTHPVAPAEMRAALEPAG